MIRFTRDALSPNKHLRATFAGLLPLAVVAVFCLGLPSLSQAQITPDQLINGAVSDTKPLYGPLSDAIARLRQGDVEGARASLTRAHREQKKLAPPEVMLANALLALNNGNLARVELEKAIQMHPEDPEAYVRLAELNAAEGRVIEAELLFGRGIKVAEKFEESPKRNEQVKILGYSRLAALDEARGNLSDSLEKLKTLIKLEPDNATNHQRLAKVLFKSGKQDEAFRELQSTTGKHAEGSEAMPAELAMAQLYSDADDRPNAESWVAKAAKKGAKSFAAQIILARWYLDNNDPKEALAHAEAALKLEPNNPDALLMRGNVARMQQDWKAAEENLTAAHMLSPLNSDVINQLALVLIEKPDEASQQRALQFADLVARLNPNSPLAAGTLGWVQFRLHNMAEAERLFGLITANTQQVPNDIAYFLACLNEEQGRTKEAQQLLDTVMKQDTSFHYRKEAQELQQKISGSSKSGSSKKSTSSKSAGADNKTSSK